MLRLKLALVASILVSALVPSIATHAETYYIATTGNNGNPGTRSLPWRTVAHAVATMVAGDTAYVRGGTYNEELIRFTRSGTQADLIKLLNYPGEYPVIHFIDPTQVHRMVFEHGAGSSNPIGWITVEGFVIENGYDGIKMYNAHDLTIQRNWIRNSKYQGILGNGTKIAIDRNIVSHNGHFTECAAGTYNCTLDHGMYLNGTSFIITNNLIYDNLGSGIQMNGNATYNAAYHPGPEFTVSSNWVIAHNTFAYQHHVSAIIMWGGRCVNATIENNIFYENRNDPARTSAQGIFFTAMRGTGNVIRNNYAYATPPGGTAFLGTTGATEGINYLQSNNIVNTENPRFVNAPATLPPSPNFALTERSPAIDAGSPSLRTERPSTALFGPKVTYSPKTTAPQK